MNNDKEGCEFCTQLRIFISPVLKILRKANGAFLEYGQVSFGSNILPKNQLNKTFLHNIPWFQNAAEEYWDIWNLIFVHLHPKQTQEY